MLRLFGSEVGCYPRQAAQAFCVHHRECPTRHPAKRFDRPGYRRHTAWSRRRGGLCWPDPDGGVLTEVALASEAGDDAGEDAVLRFDGVGSCSILQATGRRSCRRSNDDGR